MAPWLKFLIPLAFGSIGLWVFLVSPVRWGLAAFVGLFLIGSVLGTVVFRRYATPEQIKKDLEARLLDD